MRYRETSRHDDPRTRSLYDDTMVDVFALVG